MKAFVVHGRNQLGKVDNIDLPASRYAHVDIAVEWSSLNYKDAMAATGHPGVAPILPHVPGIDCAGTILVNSTGSPRPHPGEKVLVTGYELGAPQWGGWSEQVRVPSDWVVPLPDAFDTRHAMTLGTAGFTAAQCVSALVDRDITPNGGPILVTGATGGVGVWSIRLLAHLGYEVVAVTGKQDRVADLLALGAAKVVGREVLEVEDLSKPMLAARWASAIDTVGGEPLARIVRSTNYRGVVACCGLVAGTDLPLNVYPFLLRGITLAGIDSAKCPRAPRLEIWRRLSSEWHTTLPDCWINETTLAGVGHEVTNMLAGKHAGRTIIRP